MNENEKDIISWTLIERFFRDKYGVKIICIDQSWHNIDPNGAIVAFKRIDTGDPIGHIQLPYHNR